MIQFGEEALRLLAEGQFRVSDPGPLHNPISKISVRRNDKLELEIETESPAVAVAPSLELPVGTLRISTDRVVMNEFDEATAVLEAVTAYSTIIQHAASGGGKVSSKSKVHRLTVTYDDLSTADYVIDWLENFPGRDFLWPDSFSTIEKTAVVRTISGKGSGVTIPRLNERENRSKSVASLEVAGQKLHVCALDSSVKAPQRRPGCIIYEGTPDEGFRKKVRTALAFALGNFLVELGTTFYDGNWNVLEATARSAYSIDMRAFGLISTQLAPLGSEYSRQIQTPQLQRVVAALVRAHDDLDLANLSWAYWHARTATVHTSPAQFGAVIEALQRAWLKANPDRIATTIMSKSTWGPLLEKLKGSVSAHNLPAETEKLLTVRLSNLNRVDQRPKLKAILECLDIDLSRQEDVAWVRRDHGAHGIPIPEGKEIAAITDMKLLHGLFQRMLLRMTDASDEYIDYASLDHPGRRLTQPSEGSINPAG